MEFIGKDPLNVNSSIDGPGYDFTKNYYSKNGFSKDFYTYIVDWQPDYIKFFVNGNLFYTVDPSMAKGKPWAFNQISLLFLNLAFGGNWSVNPDKSSKFPQQSIIDYLRVWEKA